MELSGEILGGYFFKDLPTPQFISQEAYRLLEGRNRDKLAKKIYWMSALDPASPCGLGLWEGELPSRIASNHLVFQGSDLMVISKKYGSDLTLNFPPELEGSESLLSFFKILIGRDFSPQKRIEVKVINGEEAEASPYRDVLEKAGFIRSLKGYLLS